MTNDRKRIMSHHWIDPNACQSLAVLVESVAASLLIEHAGAVCLEVDIDGSMGIPADPTRTVDLISVLVKQALAQMPDGGELSITACETAATVELELADTGARVEARPTSLPMAAAAIGAQVIWQNCPQGGAAATIVFARQSGSGRVAA
jgi:hypothetical protein